MGLFGYAFIDLDHDQKAARREALDLYGFVAQISVISPLFILQVYFFASWLSRRFGKDDEESRPSSPYLKADATSEKGAFLRKVKLWAIRTKWWMGDELPLGLGRKGDWVVGIAWGAWLGLLCVKGTGEDYMHLTKRFGIIAGSQLPLHYLLAMRSSWSPLQWLTRMSHEQLNVAHKVLGQLIRILFLLHAAFYLNFFALNNLLGKRIKDRDVRLGLVSIWLILITTTTAWHKIRQWNYRVFYMIHVVIATAFLPAAYFHVHHIRPYIIQTAVVYILHIVLRFYHSQTGKGTLSLVPGTTDLVSVTIPLQGTSRHFKAGQHVYFSLPAGHYDSALPKIFLQNPFTVASLPKKDGQLVLVARALDGNTKRMAALARSSELQSLSLKIEGPYGGSHYLPNFAEFDRILLVAGGVGATFIIPIWRDIIEAKQHDERMAHIDVHLVWAVRKLAETSWALPFPEALDKSGSNVRSEAEVYVTGGASGSLENGSSIELAETETLVNGGDEKSLQEEGISTKHRRPDLREIVEETFSGHPGRVAVLVCGPSSMYRQLRIEVRRKAWRGNEVFWHAEEFGL